MKERVFIQVGAAIEPPGMEPRWGPFCIEYSPLEGVLGYSASCPPGTESLGASSVLMPSLCNAHMHLPDAAIADAGEELGLHELVAQPTGLKYRLLSSTSPRRVASAAREVLAALKSEGVLVAAAYAEHGFWHAVGEAAKQLGGIELKVVAQPLRKRLPDALSVLAEGYWVGLDTPLDMEPRELRILAEEARRHGYQVHVHVAEDPALAGLGDLRYAIEAGLHAAIHLTHASPGEVLEAARSGVKPVFCPIANMYFTGAAPSPYSLITLYDEEEPMGLGTDNAAWPPLGMRSLLAAAYSLYRTAVEPGSRRVLARSLLYAATSGCSKLLEAEPRWIIYRIPLLAYSSDPVLAAVKRLSAAPAPLLLSPQLGSRPAPGA